jgi:hypothetical protein
MFRKDRPYFFTGKLNAEEKGTASKAELLFPSFATNISDDGSLAPQFPLA